MLDDAATARQNAEHNQQKRDPYAVPEFFSS
jgi:hypothetical protein